MEEVYFGDRRIMKVAEQKKRLPVKRVIYLVGEGTGETISKIARASLAQFSRENVEVKTFLWLKISSTSHILLNRQQRMRPL